MADCECSGGSDERTVLVYACSGAANVAEVADQAARDLACAGKAGMFCLAGLGADIDGMVQAARDADLNLVIDGCGMDCAKKVFARHGLDNVAHVRVTDLGIEKMPKGARATRVEIESVFAKACDMLSNES